MVGQSPDSARVFDGNIDDVRIYSRALSAAEIAELAAGRHTTAVWDGSSSTDFEMAFNWNTDAVPDPYTHIIAKRSGSGSPVLAATISGASLTIEDQASLDLHGYNFEFVDGGTLKGGGTLKLLGSETISNLSNVATTSTGTVLYYGTGSYSGLAAGSSYNNLTINDGLVGYWKLDELTGTTAADASGYGNNGTLTGGPTITSTVAPTRFTNGRSVSFDGTDDYVLLPASATLNVASGQGFTTTAWVRTTDTVGNVISFRDSVNGSPVWDMAIGSNGASSNAGHFIPLVRYDSNVIVWHTATARVDDGAWHHLALVLDQAGDTLDAYIDGTRYSVEFTSNGTITTTDRRAIGVELSNSEFLAAEIDDVRIYSRALSPQEIQSLAAGSHPSSASGTYTLGSNLAVAGALTINAGNLDVSTSNYAITLSGSLINNGGKVTARKGTITLDGTASAKILQSGGQRLNALTVGAAGAWTLQDRLTMSGSLTQTAGTLDAGSGSYAIHAQTLNQSAGTIIPRAGTVVVDGVNSQSLIVNSSLNSLRVEDPTENGLVGYWKFDEMTGTTARDSSPNGNNGTLTNGPAWSGSSLNTSIQFVNSGALKFDGTDDYVDVGSGLRFTANFSASFWVKGGALDDFDIILGDYDSVSGSYGWAVRAKGTNIGVATGSSGGFTNDTYGVVANINDGAWHHIVVVVNSNGTSGTLYYDAVGDAIDFGGHGITASTASMVFGRGTSGSNPSTSILDDVRIYNRALSANEVANLYRGRYAAGGSSTATFTLGGNLSTTALSIDSGVLDTSSRTATVTNALQLIRGNGSLTHGSSTLTLNGGLTLSGALLTGGAGTIDVNGNVSIFTGSLIAPSGNLTVSGHVLMSGGMLNANAGTLTFDGSGEQTLRTLGTGDDQDFATVIMNKSAGNLTLAGNAFSGSTLQLTSGTFVPGTLAVTAGALTIDGGTLRGSTGTVDVNGNVTLSDGALVAPRASFTVAGDWSKTGGTFTHSGATVIFDGASAQTITGGGSAFSGVTLSGTSYSLGGALDVDGAFNLLSGTFSQGTAQVSIAGHTRIASGTTFAKSTNGSLLVLDGDLTFEDETLANLGRLRIVSSPDTVTLSGGILVDRLTIAAGDVLRTSGFDVRIGTGGLTNSGTLTAAANTDIHSASGVVNYGTYTAASSTLTLSGSFLNAGTFTSGTSTVTLDGLHQSLSGSTVFSTLSKTVTAAATLTFHAGDTFTVSDALTLQGAAGNLLSLRSSTTGTQWKINPQGTRTIQYVDVKDSNNTNSTAINCIGKNCTDSGNNTNWTFTASTETGGGDNGNALRIRRMLQESAGGGGGGAATTPPVSVFTPDYAPLAKALARAQDRARSGSGATTTDPIRRVALIRAALLARYLARITGKRYVEDGMDPESPAEEIVQEPEPVAPVKTPRPRRVAVEEKPRPEAKPYVAASKSVIAERRGRLLVTFDGAELFYKDVPTDAWFAPYVALVVEERIAEGYKDAAGKPLGTFGVENSITYAEVLKMALQAAGTELPKASPPPVNRSARDTWAAAFVRYAEDKSMSVFTPGLDVHQPATRGEVIHIILEALGIPTGIKLPSPFTDVPEGHRYAQAITVGAAYGLVEGDTDADGKPLGTFRPDEEINRAEGAKIISVASELVKE